MTQLPTEHPDVHEQLMQGRFSAQLGSKNPFGRIAIDQTVEETVNKDTQTPGGTKGFSLKPGAVTKYYLTAEYRTDYLKHLRNMIGVGHSKLAHPDLQHSRLKKDESDVESLVDILGNSWVDPMSHENTDLISLSTSRVAPPDVAKDLLSAHQVGEEEYEKFKTTRLEDNPPSAKFHDRMSKQNLKTFSRVNTKAVSSRGKTKDVILKADRNLFGHMILAAQSRNLHMRDVLAHPLGPLPWALSNPDGSLRKTNKAALIRELEKNVPPAEVIPSPSTSIFDGMSLVHKMNGNNKTFAQLAESALSLILRDSRQSERIDVVFDVYRETSIKNAERSRRGSSAALQYKNIAGGQNIQQWRKFLCSPVNKSCLIKFLVSEWKRERCRDMLQAKSLYVTCEEACFKLTKDGWTDVPEMSSTHEEADTRILLHAVHAAESGSKAVIVNAEDTDITILCLGFCSTIPCSIYQKCGTHNRTRFIDIDKLAHILGGSMCKALMGLHSFTGCDTVSAFTGRGKLGALKIMKKELTHQETFIELGQFWDVSPQLFERLQHFTCLMYGDASGTKDINDHRYQLFCVKRGEVESSQLPPCRDSLFLHVLRANYQAAIWRRSLQTQPTIPDPKGCGWTTEEDEAETLDIEWMRTPPAPDAVLELLSCKCARSCTLPKCTCLVNGLPCTDMCKLQDCSNRKREDVVVELGDSDGNDCDSSDDDGDGVA